ncbi:hypothetical protein FWD20_03300 [Candidatus Saccharibacteria bacterium]|nr:hypothetical protein [Candidatus Saccharibacteria bacterium]
MDVMLSGGHVQTISGADYIDDNLTYLITLATSHALPTAYHDKRALSPALRDQLVKQIAADQAGSILVASPAVE